LRCRCIPIWPNQELPPGYQFLHCIANEAAGGGSVFADGVAMAEA
jgi:gamma-butyrobetaine dioxygenase